MEQLDRSELKLSSEYRKSAVSLVLDTNVFLNKVQYWLMAEKFYTTPEVLVEVRDLHSRNFIEMAPSDIIVRRPSKESMTTVVNFAKATGDFLTLSHQDMSLIALARDIDIESHEGKADHLRTEPAGLSYKKMSISYDSRHCLGSKLLKYGNEHLGQAITEWTRPGKIGNRVAKRGELRYYEEKRKSDEERLKNADTEGSLYDNKSSVKLMSMFCSPEDPVLEKAQQKMQKRNNKKKGKNVIDTDALDSIPDLKNCYLEQNDNIKAVSKNSNNEGQPDSKDNEAIKNNSDNDNNKEEGEDVIENITKEEAQQLGEAMVAHLQEEDANMLEDEKDELIELPEEEEQPKVPTNDNGEANDAAGAETKTEEEKKSEGEEADKNKNDNEAKKAVNQFDEWITPENVELTSNYIEVETDKIVESGIFTADYAMQNVSFQMGLHVLSTTGMINKIRRFAGKCSSCNSIYPGKAGSRFCPNCGGDTMMKVAMIVGKDGVVRFSRGIKNFNLRGTVFPIPMPKPGRSGKVQVMPIMSEEDEKRFIKSVGSIGYAMLNGANVSAPSSEFSNSQLRKNLKNNRTTQNATNDSVKFFSGEVKGPSGGKVKTFATPYFMRKNPNKNIRGNKSGTVYI